jgi:hypothetical protein
MFTKKPSTIISNTIQEIKKSEVKKPLQEEKKDLLISKNSSKKRIILEGSPFKSAKQLIVNRLLCRKMTDEQISDELKIWFPEIKNGGFVPHYRSHLNAGTRYLPEGLIKIEPKLIQIKNNLDIKIPEIKIDTIIKTPLKEIKKEKIYNTKVNKEKRPVLNLQKKK